MVAKLDVRVVGFPLDNSFALNDSEGSLGDEPLWNISSIPSGSDDVDTGIEDLHSSSETVIPDSVDLFANADIDDANIFEESNFLLTDSTSSNACASQANDLTLVARADACGAKKEELVPPSNLLQLFQDPMKVLNSVIPTEKKQGPSSSADSDSPFYPGRLSDEEAARKAVSPGADQWDLKAMGLEEIQQPQDVYCAQPQQPYPVCCNGPRFSEPGWPDAGIEDCDLGTLDSEI